MIYSTTKLTVLVEDERTVGSHRDAVHRAVAVVLDVALLTLHARVTDLADLLRVVRRQLVVVHDLVEAHGVFDTVEVHEAVAHVAAVAEVDRQVEEVELAWEERDDVG